MSLLATLLGDAPSLADAARGIGPRLLAYVADAASAALLNSAAPSLLPCEVRTGDIRSAVRDLARQRSPDLLLVDLSGVAEPLAAMEALAGVCDPSVRVIAVGDSNDIGLYRDLRRIGVTDYLFKPLSRDLLEGALRAAGAGAAADEAPGRLGKLVAVVGARGGVGTTTVAVHLGCWLADGARGRTALVDLDLQNGTVALALNLRPEPALREAVEAPDRVDDVFMERAMVAASDRLSVLAAEEPVEDVIDIAPTAALSVLNRLQARHNYVVVDAGRAQGGGRPRRAGGGVYRGPGRRRQRRGPARSGAVARRHSAPGRRRAARHRPEPARRPRRASRGGPHAHAGRAAGARPALPPGAAGRRRGRRRAGLPPLPPLPRGDGAAGRRHRRPARRPGRLVPPLGAAMSTLFGRKTAPPSLAVASPPPEEPKPTPVPAPAAAPVPPPPAALRPVNRSLNDIRSQVLARIDPASIADMPAETLRPLVERLIDDIATTSRSQLNGREQATLATELVHDMIGLGPLEPPAGRRRDHGHHGQRPLPHLRRAARQAGRDAGAFPRRRTPAEHRAAHRLGGRAAGGRIQPDGRRPAGRRQPRQHRGAAAGARRRLHLHPQIRPPHHRLPRTGGVPQHVRADGPRAGDHRALPAERHHLGRHRLGQDDAAQRHVPPHRGDRARHHHRGRGRTPAPAAPRRPAGDPPAQPGGPGAGDPARSRPQRAAHASRPHHHRRGARGGGLRHAPGHEHRP
ncbi:protein of unknown function (plasmid) [Azospirillum baldaniorum]|uniref:Response regulatory domain-containing protein n=1 Tax=Azospirillum baldaniorum TaxID=1064539 RepID=A0A9P1K0Z0_9PROT|nr:protein of unknown function [Azospirillum baldaniorum]